MRPLIALCALIAFLTLGGNAAAGGWASVGFEPLPDGTSAGGTWQPTITVKQHAVTPLGGLAPFVLIEDTASGEQHQFSAAETGTTGVYEADVVFPSAGDWRITVESGFGDSRMTYGPVAIAPPAGAPRGLDVPVSAVLAALALAALAAAALLGTRRSRRPMPAGR